MNKTIYAFVFVFFSILQFNAQNFTKKWNEVYELELQGKTKTAFEKVSEIHKIALRKKNDIQQVKSFIYLSKFKNTLVENSKINFFTEIRSEINISSEIGKAFLHQYYATKLSEFYTYDYSIRIRPKMIDSTSSDVSIWDKEKFEFEILSNFEKSFKNQALLSTLKVEDFAELITPVDFYFIDKNKNLYQFFIENNIIEYKKSGFYHDIDTSIKFNENYFSDKETFVNLDLNSIENEISRKIGKLYQILEKSTLEKSSIFTLNRIKYFYGESNNSENKDIQLEKCKDYFKDSKLIHELELIEAKQLIYNKYLPNASDNNIKALTLLNKIILDKANPIIYTEATNLRQDILSKYLSVEMKKEVYPNENLRAFVRYQNMDSLVISYYKINLKEINSFTSDSLVLEHINKNKPIKSYFKTLTKKEDYFGHSTEILLEPFETGNYLVVVGKPKNNENYNFVYNIVNCNVIDYFKTEENKVDSYYFRHRKTGKPLKNVIIRTAEKAYLSDEFGKFSISQPDNKNKKLNSYELTFIHENDSITKTISLYNYNYNRETKPNFNAKAYVYTDRSIYRPGQKMFYKGIITQENNYKISVVPFLTVKVKISDDSGETLKTLEVQTNEFGSFSGEFDIPKNGILGDYEITIYEPDNYKNDSKYYNEEEEEHSFWDKVNFNNNYTHFKVEEYKRPTFEVTLDKITTEWKLGDTIILKGKATGLAGNTISDATTKGHVDCYINENDGNSRTFNYQTIITKTKLDGTFEIEIPTKLLNIKNSTYTCNFNIYIEVFDINGEVRFTQEKINLSDKEFYLNIISGWKKIKEDKNKQIKIEAKTFNETQKQVIGKLHIYKNDVLNNLITRPFDEPDIKTIDSLTFTKLFPYEKSMGLKKKLIKTLDFDSNKPININFLDIGSYIFEAEAYDTNNNKIIVTKNLNIITNIPTKLTNQLFKYYINSNENSKNVEVVLTSKIDDLFVTCFEYDEKGTIVKEHKIQLRNGEGKFTLPKPKNRLGLYFYAFFENYFYSEEHTSHYTAEMNQLKFEIISMRNKIEPGSNENWQFKILNSKLEAEILASMYDVSLDEFTRHDWNAFDRDEPRINFPFFSNNNEIIFFNFYNSDTDQSTFKFNSENRLNWFKNKTTEIKSKLKKTDYIYGNILSKDEIPANILVTNLTHPGTTNTDFYGNFSIEGKLNDILEIQLKNQTFIYKVTDIKNLKLKLNIETNPEIAPQQANVFVKSRYIPLRSKKITIDNKAFFYQTNSMYLNTVKMKTEEVAFFNGTGSAEIEVVQIAFGIQRKKTSVALNYTTIQSSEINLAASQNAIIALVGKVSGLQIDTLNGSPNATPRIVINGNRSITGNNNALIVIDNIVSTAENLMQIQPDFIESMQVLKGAQGSALYGEQGANGVLIVTTKKINQELVNIKTRKNFNETAFFYPHIKTDKNGKFTLEFTTPESLTKWKLNVIGHNKLGEMGGFGSEIIAQKDVMIIPNLPRFVRENDELVVTAKISNLLNEAKPGFAKLTLFDAGLGNPIEILMDSKEIQSFNCEPKGSTIVQWKIKIPKDIQGLQYKIVAKAGNFTDGEENILPVLKNAVLITESQPVWLKENDSKTYTFDAQKTNSSTKENYKISINLVTNPIWSVIESLPFLMEYEHDCAEQTFSKLFANSISEKIVNDNPKIKTLLEKWKQNPTSKLKMNEELKSVLLSETPWLIENNNELQKRISALLDITKLKETNDILFRKLKEKQSSNGGFSWFGVDNENEYITRHILSGIGHLSKINPENKTKFKDVVSKGIIYLDSKFGTLKTNQIANNDLHYLYARSFFLDEYPISKKQDSIIKIQLNNYKKNWLQQSLYQKTILALVLNRFKDTNFAKKIIEHLRESTILDETKGMFWTANTNGYYWYQSNIELQALLIEAFAEIDYKEKEIEAMKVWLINNKQNKNWNTTKSTALAINAIISYGKDWTNSESKIVLNNGKNNVIQKQIESKLKESETGLINLEFIKTQIPLLTNEIKIENKGVAPIYGGIYYQYFENLDKISATNAIDYSISKELIKDNKVADTNNLKVGDLITIRLTFKTEKDLEFVHVKDLRASCFEPLNVISERKWINNSHYYMSTKDIATHFFFDNLPKGTYVLEYQVRVNNEGIFSDGFANLQNMYAPEFSAHSASRNITTTK